MPHPQPGSAPPADTPGADPAEPGSSTSSDDPLTAHRGTAAGEDTLNLGLPRERPEPPSRREPRSHAFSAPCVNVGREHADAPDTPADWPAVVTDAGRFQLVPVHLARDLPLISAWMNDPVVAAFWELAGPERVTEAHLRPQLEGDGRSIPCLGVLDGAPMSYWELYRADLDPLARHCRTRPHDTGLHLLIGAAAHRGRGLGSLLLRTVADLVLDQRPRCTRVLAEPDVRNVPSVAAFLGAGFRLSAEIQLPGKRAALMVRDRELRHAL
ncbi:GNAT family N-acetyltransferase [Streptomyces sp. 8N114]|uniref:GNAT family N-acetyltransferase n=1 Tax=Streptomyces sp. 8N114 TaxID=3457419 RepID=UPI003FD59922